MSELVWLTTGIIGVHTIISCLLIGDPSRIGTAVGGSRRKSMSKTDKSSVAGRPRPYLCISQGARFIMHLL